VAGSDVFANVSERVGDRKREKEGEGERGIDGDTR